MTSVAETHVVGILAVPEQRKSREDCPLCQIVCYSPTNQHQVDITGDPSPMVKALQGLRVPQLVLEESP